MRGEGLQGTTLTSWRTSDEHPNNEHESRNQGSQTEEVLEEKAATSDEPIERLACSVKSLLDFECRVKLGCQPKSLKMVSSVRAAANPSSLEILSIPSSYLYSLSGDYLLQWDSGYSSSRRRSILVGTLDNINTLASCNNLIIDVTLQFMDSLMTRVPILLFGPSLTPSNWSKTH